MFDSFSLTHLGKANLSIPSFEQTIGWCIDHNIRLVLCWSHERTACSCCGSKASFLENWAAYDSTRISPKSWSVQPNSHKGGGWWQVQPWNREEAGERSERQSC